MKSLGFRVSSVFLLLIPVSSVPAADFLLFSPGFPPSKVDSEGVLHESWGTFALRLSEPEGGKKIGQRYDREGPPTVVTTFRAGAVVLVEEAYRSPIWPAGIDVVAAKVENTSDRPEAIVLEAVFPPEVSCGDKFAVARGRTVLALPKNLPRLPPEERKWGCAGGVVPMPGWAKPEGKCDPGFRNIRAGMGGVPITYRFAVEPGSKRQVVLGFCESFWSEPGRRPLLIEVEGAPRAEIDPLEKWGQHKPGCLLFISRDENGDGRLEITVAPHPRASDKNPILNVIWIFPTGIKVNTNRVLKGEMNRRAEYYVDVGGERDQSLYKPGPVRFALRLPPESERRFLFLLASPGGGPVPDPERSAWTAESLRKAAEEVWAAHPEVHGR